MHAHHLNAGTEQTWAVILEDGEEVMAALQHFAEERRLGGSRVTAIGAFQHAELGFWDVDQQEYLPTAVDQQSEVLSLLGDITLDQDAQPKLHLHAVLGLRDASTRGGHLLSGLVRPTLELLIVESPRHLQRRFDPALGLPLIATAEGG